MGKFGTEPWVMPAGFAALVCLLSAVSIYSMKKPMTFLLIVLDCARGRVAELPPRTG